MNEAVDAQPVDVAPLRWQEITHGGRRFRLRSAIEVSVDFDDDLWIHEYEPLGILACGASPEESLEAFRTDFAACADSIAQEDDANLTADARELKGKLIGLVDSVEELA